MNNEGQNLEKAEGLVKPSLAYKDSFLAATKEFENAGENIYMRGHKPNEDFDQVLLKVKQDENKEQPEGRVPQTQRWLISNGEFVGWTKIRHALNEKLLIEGGHIGYAIRPSRRKDGFGTKILELALKEAKILGLKKVLLTCDDDNLASARIIEKNGGVLENKIEHDGKLKRRYWIEIK